MRHGWGTLELAEGDVYEGEFEEDGVHGGWRKVV